MVITAEVRNYWPRRIELYHKDFTQSEDWRITNNNAAVAEFPPAPLTAETTRLPDGAYTVSASSSVNNSAFQPYNKYGNDDDVWLTDPLYNLGNYTGTVTTFVEGSNVSGEWTQLIMPCGCY
jgi:hypothetical protein